ncbi:MAG TPA: 3-methyl-2-oxobutanoate hydroxymethyltransferase [Dissulfurispiraceae bacterium]|nr:3-methyl-2-oxobutanoate hydroxymethyltransferase [Dissulfurispiraceae bacterium]
MKITVNDFYKKKLAAEKITMLTAYDYPTAQMVDEAGIEAILVGDSVSMVVQGIANTLPVTMDEMIYHTKMVARAAKIAMVIGDMPYMSYHISVEEALRNAGRFIKEGGAQAVKLEGGREVAGIVAAVTRAEIPVMAHIGLTPQAFHRMGGFKVQGRSKEAAERLLEDAKILEDAGAFSIVVEAVPADLATQITKSLAIPTIGIGAGVECDGQVLVLHDLLGLFERFLPKFAKRYVNLKELGVKAIQDYKKEVEEGKFPGPEHSFS